MESFEVGSFRVDKLGFAGENHPEWAVMNLEVGGYSAYCYEENDAREVAKALDFLYHPMKYGYVLSE